MGRGPGLTRLPDWRVRLQAYVETVRRRPFEYGETDCAIFVAGAVEAMTGEDHAAAYRGRYSTMAEGLALIDYHDHVAMVAHYLAEIPRSALAQVEVGDIAVIRSPDGQAALGVVGGARVFCWTEGGLVTISLFDETDPSRPRLNIIRAFRV